MCGICCCLFLDNRSSRSCYQIISDSVLPHLQRRGPDHTGKRDCSITNDSGKFNLMLVGTVLHLRGTKTPQPLEDESGNILLWNGEIFGGIEVKEDENDSFVLLNILSNCPSDMSSSQHILSTMAKVQGPWGFVYWQISEQKLWFGRDYFGRRSLLWHLPSNPNDVLAVTSVAERNSAAAGADLNFEEIPADGLYCVDLVSSTTDQGGKQPFNISKFEWKIPGEELQSSVFLSCPVTPFNKQMPTKQDFQIIEKHRRKFRPLENEHVANEMKVEETSMKECKEMFKRDNYVRNFSEELAAAMSHLETVENENVTLPYILELNDANNECLCGLNANGSSAKPTSRDSATRDYEVNSSESPYNCDSYCSPVEIVDTGHSTHSCLELSRNELTITNITGESTNVSSTGVIAGGCLHCNFLRSHGEWNSCYKESRDKFIAVLGDAVRKRVWNLPRTTCNRNLVSSNFSSGSSTESRSLETSLMRDARVGILFSGGIDSIMIAALADKYVPVGEAIDLINVAFEQKVQSSHPQNRTAKKGKKRQNATQAKPARNFSVPDRITGVSGLEELRCINPSRQWNFVEVDVTLEELQEMRSRHISHLVSPLNTVLDDSIGCALWFAARGVGRLRPSSANSGLNQDNEANDEEKTFTSKAKVLLVGMGADEQLGGYARHRTRFNVEGWLGLMEEMEMEVKRISKRNLGRDDRCISDHGREARFPFLDEEVVSFLNSLPVWLKTDPDLPRGIGEKQLLRQAARLLGLTSSSGLPKRAIQFGSRIAKLESSAEKGSETCSRLEF